MKRLCAALFLILLALTSTAQARPVRFVQRMGVSNFTPKSINGLTLWLDAKDASTITIATGVSQWNDKSGQGNHVTQGTGANQPAYTSADLNGKNVLTFDATDTLTNANPSGLTAIAGITFFMVWRDVADPDYAELVSISAASRSWLFYYYLPTTVASWSGTSNGVAGAESAAIAAASTWYRSKGTYNPATGALTTANNANTQTGAVVATGALIYEGAEVLRVGSAGTIKVAEIIFYNRILTASEITKVDRYLTRQWAVGS